MVFPVDIDIITNILILHSLGYNKATIGYDDDFENKVPIFNDKYFDNKVTTVYGGDFVLIIRWRIVTITIW